MLFFHGIIFSRRAMMYVVLLLLLAITNSISLTQQQTISYKNITKIASNYDHDTLLHQIITYKIIKNIKKNKTLLPFSSSFKLVSTIYSDGCEYIANNDNDDSNVVKIINDNEILNVTNNNKIDYGKVHVALNMNDNTISSSNSLFKVLSNNNTKIGKLTYCIRADLYNIVDNNDDHVIVDNNIDRANYIANNNIDRANYIADNNNDNIDNNNDTKTNKNGMVLVSYTETNFVLTFNINSILKLSTDNNTKNNIINDVIKVYDNVNYDVISCICDKDNNGDSKHTCNSDDTTIVEENKDIDICIITTSKHNNIINIQDLAFEQLTHDDSESKKGALHYSSDDADQSIPYIKYGKIMNPFTKINKIGNHDDTIVVKTRITTLLFDDNNNKNDEALSHPVIILKGNVKLSIDSNDNNNRNLVKQSRNKRDKRDDEIISKYVLLFQVKRKQSLTKNEGGSSMINISSNDYDSNSGLASSILFLFILIGLLSYFSIGNNDSSDSTCVSNENKKELTAITNDENSSNENHDGNGGDNDDLTVAHGNESKLNDNKSKRGSNTGISTTSSNDDDAEEQRRASTQFPTSHDSSSRRNSTTTLSLFDDSNNNDDDDNWEYNDYEGYKAAMVDTIFKHNNNIKESLRSDENHDQQQQQLKDKNNRYNKDEGFLHTSIESVELV